MAHAQRHRFDSVKEHLGSEVHRYDFFQAVNLLHLITPEVSPLGTTDSPKNEGVRFHPTASFSFAPSSLQGIELPQENGKVPAKLSTSFLSLYGREGALPWHYTTQLKQEEREFKKKAMRSFLDIINHRLISHFYRAGVKYRLPNHYHHRHTHSVAMKLAGLSGLGTRGLPQKRGLVYERLFRYSSFLQQPRSASALRGLLTEYFEIPVKVDQFVGEWVPIEKSSRTRIGKRGRNNQLGHSVCAGKRTWSVQHKFRIVFGPLPYESYLQMQPDTEQYNEVVEVIKLFVGLSFSFQLAFQVENSTVPGMILGSKKMALGRSIWMTSSGIDGTLSHTFETEKTRNIINNK